MTTGSHFLSALEGITLEEATPLAKALSVDISRQPKGFLGDNIKNELWSSLSYYGSNDIAYALRGFEGIDYPEILFDVSKKMKVKDLMSETTDAAVEANEKRLMEKMFTDIWDKMSSEERVALMAAMDIGGGDAKLGGGAALAAIYGASLGGFATYRIAVVVANVIARALLGEGLAFGTNMALTRAISMALGPIGWVVGGAWLVKDLASPAYRKTVPAVLQIAALRQLYLNRSLVGIVGKASVGKDSLMKAVFGIETGDISLIPGSTTGIKEYQVDGSSLVRVINFPGFHDLDPRVRKDVDERMDNCGLVIFMVDSEKHVLNDQVAILDRVRTIQRGKKDGHLEVVFNRLDRVEEDVVTVEDVVAWNREKLGLDKDPVLLSLKVDRNGRKHPLFGSGVQDLRARINAWLVDTRKQTPLPE